MLTPAMERFMESVEDDSVPLEKALWLAIDALRQEPEQETLQAIEDVLSVGYMKGTLC